MPTYIKIAGVDIDISHLAPSQHIVEVPMRGGGLKKMPVHIAYTNHCYSRKARAAINEQIPAGHLVMDGKKQRMFCDRRHRLSLKLPQIMADLIVSENHVWTITGNNFVQVEMVDEEADGSVTKISYYVLMRIQKHAEPGAQKHVTVRVETAFPEDLLFYDKPVLKKPFSFRKLLACVWEERDHNEPEPKKKPKKK